jgi:hypothetical protein
MIEIPDFRQTVIQVGMTEAMRLLMAVKQMPHEELSFLAHSLWLNEWMLGWVVMTEKGEVRRGALQKKINEPKKCKWFE